MPEQNEQQNQLGYREGCWDEQHGINALMLAQMEQQTQKKKKKLQHCCNQRSNALQTQVLAGHAHGH